MHDLDHNEDRPRGTYEFPFEFHHIDHTHPRYVMSYHWHVEYEIIRILEGSLTVTLDEKSFTAVKNDVIFVHSGILHSGIPHDCVYQCIVFDMNTFLKNNPVCGEYIQKILHQETMLFPHFSDEHPQILNCISVLFDAMYEKDTGYELTVFGQFYHFFGLVFSNHYFIENPTRTRRDYKRITVEAGSGIYRKKLCQSYHTSGTVCFCLYVTEIFLQVLFGNDTSDSCGLSEQTEN